MVSTQCRLSVSVLPTAGLAPVDRTVPHEKPSVAPSRLDAARARRRQNQWFEAAADGAKQSLARPLRVRC